MTPAVYSVIIATAQHSAGTNSLSRGGALSSSQGLKFVHFSAQLEHFLWDTLGGLGDNSETKRLRSS